ncbi:hypothetical protein BpHYR1_008991 [Brachionus plicatilis]|uniref:Uncharacterized protein n=1 Tax=Brachionus plicatilis TaxID=10195 RepID=A0A3M7QD48_BRAPC|nr:hypothetical protein BpHYR1_008991 [Brachionus plicatilis]
MNFKQRIQITAFFEYNQSNTEKHIHRQKNRVLHTKMFGVWWFLDRRKSANKASDFIYSNKLKTKIYWYKIIIFVLVFLMKSSQASPTHFEALGEIEDDNLFADDKPAFPDSATKRALKPIDEDSYINYLLRAASFNQQLYSNKLQRHLNFQPQFSETTIRKVFKLDKNLQRLEKKSWKIPIKSVALYTENSQDSKIIGDLKELFHSFKDS